MVLVEQRLMGLNGDEAVAYALRQINPDVVSAYPITPQTIIVERFSEYVANGEVETEFIAVESEHSALTACITAEAAGARAFTCTAANGLAFMWEMTYIAASLRLPVIMAVANRALSGPLNIHGDHSDSMGARDSGWIQLYCENSQEAYDTVIQAWRIGEHPEVQLPVMICLDGFILSHTLENVMTLPDGVVKDFVGKRIFTKVRGHAGEVEYRLDPAQPLTMGSMDLYDFYFEHKRQQADAMEKALPVIENVGKEYGRTSGRTYGLVDPYRLGDAEIAVVGLGSTMGTAKAVVEQLRSEGLKAGLLRIRAFRPFPAEEIVNALSHVKSVGILDRAMSFGALGGPLFNEVRNVFYDESRKPLISDHIYGLGGRDMSMELLGKVFRSLKEDKEAGRVLEPVRYVGLRE
jgi:pyruvate ferredoxin oxidoreductase alpha subunit